MRLVEQLLLGQGDTHMFVALAGVNLGNDIESDTLLLPNVLLVIHQFKSVLRSDYLLENS